MRGYVHRGHVLRGFVIHSPDTERCPALPVIGRIAANANYHRRQNRLQHPQDVDFDMNNDHIQDQFLHRDIHVEEV